MNKMLQEYGTLKAIRTPSLFEPPIMKKKSSFKFIDLFAGIGGTRLGFERAGGECVFSSEWDPFAQKTYQANFNEIPHGDITKISPEQIPDFNILVAGFPCQPFSSIGKRQGFKHATQGTLFYDVLRIIEAKQNEAFLLENVPGLTTHDNGNTFKTILSALDEIGYNVHYKILDAANFGVPQQRKRIYIVGLRKDLKSNQNFIFPIGNDKDVSINKYIEEWKKNDC
jgi:DNA (cytosine-5)-methyltransferase 1